MKDNNQKVAMKKLKLNTLIVEDSTKTREYLTMQLECLENVNIIGSVGTFQEAMHILKDRVDLLVADLGLPDGNGIDLIREVKKQKNAKAIVVTVFGDENNVVDSIEAGADGYLLKDADSYEIAEAVMNTINGIAPISPAIAGHLLRKIKQESASVDRDTLSNPDQVYLTKKETIILETLAKGFSYKEIARIQNISFHTVNKHLKSIYRKLSVNSRGEAVYEAVQAGLIE